MRSQPIDADPIGGDLLSGLAGALSIHLRRTHALAQSHVFVRTLALLVPEGPLGPSKLGRYLLQSSVKSSVDVRAFAFSAHHLERTHLHVHRAAVGVTLSREVNR